MQRRHIYKYVEEQNRETSVAARIFKPQQMATANSELKAGNDKSKIPDRGVGYGKRFKERVHDYF